MKKLKLLILGIFGLLTFVSSYSFGLMKSDQGFFVETISSAGGSIFSNQFNVDTTYNHCSYNGYRKFLINRYFNGSSSLFSVGNIGNSYYGYFNSYDWSSWPSNYFGSRRTDANQSYSTGNLRVLYSTSPDSFGNLFLNMNRFGDGPKNDGISGCPTNCASPYFGFGSGFITSTYNLGTFGDYYGGVRLFFDCFDTGNLCIDPVVGFDVNSMNGSTQSPFVLLSKFTPRLSQAVAKFGDNSLNGQNVVTRYIGDHGGSFYKGKHFSLFGLGYSYIYNRFSDNSIITTGSWDFANVSSRVINFLYSNSANYSTLGDNKVLTSGIGVFKGNTYSNSSTDSSMILIARDKENIHRILYSLYDCGGVTDGVLEIYNSNHCNNLGNGYLGLYSGSSLTPDILFNDSDSYSLSSKNNPFFDFFFNGAILGSTIIDGQGVTFNSIVDNSSTCPNPSINQSLRLYFVASDTNIDDQYDVSWPSNNGGGSSNGGSLVSPYYSIYYDCLGVTGSNAPAYCYNPDGSLIDLSEYRECYYQIYDTPVSGDDITHIFCQVGGYMQEMNWIQSGSGGYFSICTGSDCGNFFTISTNDVNYFSGELSTGLVEDIITNLTGWILKCPFSYEDFQLGKNIPVLKYFKSLGFDFDPFVFINCSWAGLQYGRSLVDESLGLGNLWEYGPLIKRSGSSFVYTNALCSFFDFILILTLIGLVKFIKKLF